MKFFNKKQTSLLLAATIIVGSIVTFYGTNMILSDVSNMFYSKINLDVVTSLPIFLISFQMVAIFLCLLDLATDPENARKIIVGSMDVVVFTSLLGFATTIVTYAFMYYKFMAPYPFKGASVILIIYYVLMFVAGSFLNVWGQGLEKPEKKKGGFGNAIFKIVRAIFVFYAFNRFGALLLSPTYIQWRTLGLTCPFYLSLLVPITLVSLMVYSSLDFGGKGAKSGLILAVVVFVADVILSACVFILGAMYTKFPAAISPALPLERLITMPIDVIIQCVVSTLLGAYAVIGIAKRYKNDKRAD